MIHKNYKGELVFDQPFSKTEWVIEHHLNKKPKVVVKDTAGTEIKGIVKYPTKNKLIIEFNSPVCGYAYLK